MRNKSATAIVLLSLLCLVLAYFLYTEHKEHVQLSSAIAYQHLSVEREVCLWLESDTADSYENFLRTAYQYEGISSIYEDDMGGWKAVQPFTDQEYYVAAPENRQKIADLLRSSEEATSREEKNALIMEANQTSADLYNAWSEDASS